MNKNTQLGRKMLGNHKERIEISKYKGSTKKLKLLEHLSLISFSFALFLPQADHG